MRDITPEGIEKTAQKEIRDFTKDLMETEEEIANLESRVESLKRQIVEKWEQWKVIRGHIEKSRINLAGIRTRISYEKEGKRKG